MIGYTDIEVEIYYLLLNIKNLILFKVSRCFVMIKVNLNRQLY